MVKIKLKFDAAEPCRTGVWTAKFSALAEADAGNRCAVRAGENKLHTGCTDLQNDKRTDKNNGKKILRYQKMLVHLFSQFKTNY
ncbi:MAG: hypothetical protein IKJ40_09050 [Bacteroidales bacterium]|nr:hypothetical protein [Bacteroidales bacterium]